MSTKLMAIPIEPVVERMHGIHSAPVLPDTRASQLMVTVDVTIVDIALPAIGHMREISKDAGVAFDTLAHHFITATRNSVRPERKRPSSNG